MDVMSPAIGARREKNVWRDGRERSWVVMYISLSNLRLKERERKDR